MDSKQKKMLLIFPPQWTPISPHFAIPSLIGQIKSAGFIAEAMDLNIDFFNDVLTKENLEQSYLFAKQSLDELKNDLLSIYSPEKKANDYNLEEQIFLYRYNKLNKFFQSHSDYLNYVPDSIDEAKNNLKTEKFYNPSVCIKSLNIIDKALEIVSLPFTPTRIEFEGLQNPFFKFNYETIKYFVFHKQSNIFYEYYKTKINEILQKNADFIAISLNSSSQIIPGLTLTSMLKKLTKAHINIGGNFFGRIAEGLKNHREFFEIFADSVSVEEGEGPIVEIAKFVNGKLSIEKVHNLMYLKDGEVVFNEKMKPVKLNDMANMDVTDYCQEKYFAPKIVMPYQSSRGCYWGKCSFCDQDFGQNFNVKNTEKIINEFKEFKEKYNIDSFEFIDESVSPVALNLLSDALENNNLKVSFFVDARLETDFTKEILNKASNAGLKMALWGLESGSKNVLELINKGIDIDRRFDILKDAKEAGIWNFAFIFFGFPTETVQDAIKTVKMLVENKDIIHSYGRSVYTMGRHSKLAAEPQKYGIKKIYPAEDEFSPNINFDGTGMTKQELQAIFDYCLKECSVAYNNPLWMYLRTREYLFLYVDKFGSDWVKNYNVKEGLQL
ncbi:radical SAM protein [bacterium]|nr:radical SAM protein [bacterium]